MAEDLRALEELDQIAGDLLRELSATGRRGMVRKIGIELRRDQAKRIADQKNPDGTPYTPRKKKLQARRTLHAIKFLYPAHGSGQPRLVLMKSWAYMGRRTIIGFDTQSGGERTFDRTKIIRYLPLEPGEDNRGSGRMKKLTVKQRAMFKKIRGPRFMRVKVSPDLLEVGFSGKVAQIANSHQQGKDHHPVRELIGFSQANRETVLDIVMRHFEG
ncbi:hypothetical protein MMA231_02478 [Asticcacaulis sp. MM231]|uniref:phage virion morphogenesis protein n=1 Tax=Asticcacaulis sp. MM231 TaxID=3157666 RepID=UPI0032D57914